MIKPLVSVCCITYNHVNYIKDALDGFLMQKTDFPFEICLGEDESFDGTREICKTYAQKYPEKIRLFLRNRKDVMYINGRATGRYNFLETLKVCKGKYIALCDGDDYWTDPYKLQKQVDFLEANSEYSFCGSEIIIEDEKGKYLDKFPYLQKGKDINIFNLENYLYYPFSVFHTSSIVMRKYSEIIIDKLSKYSLGDLAITVSLLTLGDGYMFNEKFSTYRIHKGGIWSGGNISPSINQLFIKLNDYKRLEYDFPITKEFIAPIKKHLYNDLANKFAKNRQLLKSIYYYFLGLISKSEIIDKNWLARLNYNLWLYKKVIINK
jgi:glycosyltransferase involved in cell wall biosynthesis